MKTKKIKTKESEGAKIEAPKFFENENSKPLSSDPLSSDPLSSEPLSSEPLSSEPLSSEPLSSEPLSSEPLNSDMEKDKLFDVLNSFKSDNEKDNSDFIQEPEIKENDNVTVENVDVKLSDFITGYTLLVIYDRVYPKLLKYLLKLLFKVNIPEVHLDEDEAAILEPIADKIASQLTIKVNPLLALFVLSNIFYLNKLDAEGIFENLKPKKQMKKRGRPKKTEKNENIN